MASEPPEPTESLKTWLLCRVAQAVEAGEIPADLLTELQAEFEAAMAIPADEGRARAVEAIVKLVVVSQEKAAQALAALEAPPRAVQEWQMRRIAEAWLEGQPKLIRVREEARVERRDA